MFLYDTLRLIFVVAFRIIEYIIKAGRDQSLLLKDIHFTTLQEYNILTVLYLLLNKYGRFKIKRYMTVKLLNIFNRIDSDSMYSDAVRPLIGENILQLNTLFLNMENGCIDLTPFVSFTEGAIIKLYVSDTMKIVKYTFNNTIVDSLEKEDNTSLKIRYYLFHCLNISNHSSGHLISCLFQNETRSLLKPNTPVYNFVVHLLGSEESFINDMIGYNYAAMENLTIISLLRPDYTSKYHGFVMDPALLLPYMKKEQSLSVVCQDVLEKVSKVYDYDSAVKTRISAIIKIHTALNEYIDQYINICYPNDDITDYETITWLNEMSRLMNYVYNVKDSNYKRSLKKMFCFLTDCIITHSLSHPDLTSKFLSLTLSTGRIHNFLISLLVSTTDSQTYFYLDNLDLSVWPDLSTKYITEKLIQKLKAVSTDLRITYVHY